MRIAEELAGRQFNNVIPVLDSGQDTESGGYFVVMARAERSLQSLLDNGRVFSEDETVQILLEVLHGLEEIGDFVHRDLKPGNVLLHEGVWKVADLGIARFVEESTSRHTLKDCLSPLYGAPEQWRLESASPATDLYALGRMGFALLTGRPPFAGANREEVRNAHLHVTPPVLSGMSPELASLLSMLLRKPPEARPSRTRVRSLLEQARVASAAPAVGGLAQLAHAGAAWER